MQIEQKYTIRFVQYFIENPIDNMKIMSII